jgi:hypothetical protein
MHPSISAWLEARADHRRTGEAASEALALAKVLAKPDVARLRHAARSDLVKGAVLWTRHGDLDDKYEWIMIARVDEPMTGWFSTTEDVTHSSLGGRMIEEPEHPGTPRAASTPTGEVPAPAPSRTVREPSRDAIEATVLDCVGAGIKGVELACEVAMRHSRAADTLLDVLRDMVEAGRIVEVEYVTPENERDGNARVKSFYLPAGTRVREREPAAA